MPTLDDLYGDVYDIPQEDLPDAYLDSGPVYPDKKHKKEQELVVPQKADKSTLKTASPAKTNKRSNTAFTVSNTYGKSSGGDIKI